MKDRTIIIVMLVLIFLLIVAGIVSHNIVW